MTSNTSQTIECFIVILSILLIFFGTIWVSGNAAGADLTNHLPSLSWDLVNTEELRKIVPL
ncbi:hypothetical protein [Halobacillus massiliensis]|uniref:hypothetical protein n=1 Tax=Halobacillus massiliensis TaxID=1926286 RepID=UPI0009E49396|nr:hypothetical protein [Halobacillus massiliensis]